MTFEEMVQKAIADCGPMTEREVALCSVALVLAKALDDERKDA